jgi:hypothetical protein
MDREEVLAAAPHLAGSLLPAVRYATRREPDAGMDLGQSKLGGAPDVARGIPWPCFEGPDGEPHHLQFFAQVDLGAAAAAAPVPLGLPTEGLLSFFADHPGSNRCCILYTSPSEPLLRCGLRMEPIPTALLRPLPIWTWPSGEVDLAATVEDRLRPSLPEGWHVTGRHQLGGHGLVDAGPGNRLLLQIDIDDSLDLYLGGTLRWTAPAEDVAAARWDTATFTPR